MGLGLVIVGIMVIDARSIRLSFFHSRFKKFELGIILRVYATFSTSSFNNRVVFDLRETAAVATFLFRARMSRTDCYQEARAHAEQDQKAD